MGLWTAFIVGLLGSFHCIGMCGPIAVALPGQNQPLPVVIISRILYNLGRIVTYTFLGGLFGVLGLTVFLAGYQQVLSIVTGALIIIIALIPDRQLNRLWDTLKITPVLAQFNRFFRSVFRFNSPFGLLIIGILNGFLPCGFVYIGLAGSMVTGSIGGGMIYMALFGLGTMPIMLATSLAGSFISPKVRSRIYRFLPIAAVLLGILFILRGLALDIAFISPKFY